MGQAISRQPVTGETNNNNRTPQGTPPSASHDGVGDEHAVVARETRGGERPSTVKRPSKFRRSVIDRIRPRSMSLAPDSAPEQPGERSTTERSSWRKRRWSSRRMSTIPVPFTQRTPGDDRPQQNDVMSIDPPHTSTSQGSAVLARHPSVVSLSTNSKGKERAVQSDKPSPHPNGALPATLSGNSNAVAGSSHGAVGGLSDNHLGLGHGAQRRPSQMTARSSRLSQIGNETGPNALSAPNPVAPPPVTPTSDAAQQAAETDGARTAFPPAGTLVVVQGVVHTSDTGLPGSGSSTPVNAPPSSTNDSSNPRSSSQPRSTTPLGSRNRLSQLLGHPSSLLGASGAPSENAARPGSTYDLNQGPSDDRDEPRGSTTDGPVPSAAEETRPVPPAPANDRSPGISSSSIDVLGTLLSVAAAATAASLVTGSSDPLFSSGLASSNPNPSGPTLPSNPPAQPGALLPPTPTPSPLAALAALANPPERRRTPWEGLRDRFGMNRPGNNPSLPLRPDGTPMDAREIMLHEMVRALNLGLGGNGPSNANSNVTATSPTSLAVTSEPSESAAPGTQGQSQATSTPTNPIQRGSPPRPSPPEGSFEEFIANLQTDLRIALSDERPEESTPRPDDAAPANDPAHDVSSSQLAASANLTDEPSTSDVAPTAEDEHPGPVVIVTGPSGEGTESEAMPNLAGSGSSHHSGDRLDDSPIVTPSAIPQDGTSSGRESSLDLAERTENHVPPAADVLPNAGPATTNFPGGVERAGNGGINWWRLYRFPAMSAPQARGLTPPTQFPSSAPSPLRESAQSAVTPEANPSRLDQPLPPSQDEATPAAGANTVVPIIVVGLQSVNGRLFDPGAPHDDPLPNRPTDETGPDPSRDNGYAFPAGDGAEADRFDRPTTPQGRRWQSRAADAMRGLLPGRRNGADRREGEGFGNRTFLIYVIGGYYPPNHHLVTGSDNLESFEALLELAELLGHVKPPVATKEEIEKSGLQILKPSDLPELEKANKVASNCVDRCLICLDDYEDTDELRLMSCRHVFHKDCVDKWMQTGRNNCPACRSQGVSTDGLQTP